MFYRTVDGDMVDAICARHYPNVSLYQAISEVLKANPGLAKQGAVLPRGLRIELPVIETVDTEVTIQLWD